MIGIIANPSSGKDIRRLIANATCFDNMEKVNIIQRIMVVFNRMSDAQILFMDDAYGMMYKAQENVRRLMKVEVNTDLLPFRPMLDQTDSAKAAGMLKDLGAKCIIVLGGDGTNRMVAKECGDVPLIPLSTGTNNVFPYMIEGTVAGLAALVAENDQDGSVLRVNRRKKLNVYKNGELVDIALIDVCVTNDTFVASRAVWNVDSIQELFVTVAKPDSIGMSAIVGSYTAIDELAPEGYYMQCGTPAKARTMAAIAPGLLHPVNIRDGRKMSFGERIRVDTRAGMLALDGEREVEFLQKDVVEIELSAEGPYVVDVPATLCCAANNGLFILPLAEEGQNT